MLLVIVDHGFAVPVLTQLERVPPIRSTVYPKEQPLGSGPFDEVVVVGFLVQVRHDRPPGALQFVVEFPLFIAPYLADGYHRYAEGLHLHWDLADGYRYAEHLGTRGPRIRLPQSRVDALWIDLELRSAGLPKQLQSTAADRPIKS
jgi:hypothetical protein